MTLDKIRTGTGRKLRTEGLTEIALPIPYDAAVMPGAVVLGTDGRAYISMKGAPGASYEWTRVVTADGSQQVLFGDLKAPVGSSLFGGGTQFVSVQIGGNTQGSSRILLYRAGGVPSLNFASSNGTIENPLPRGQLALDSTDASLFLGQIVFDAFDGTQMRRSAQIDCTLGSEVIPGGATSTMYPGSLRFRTTSPGGNQPDVRLTVTPDGNILINNTTGTERLSVTGNIQLTEATDSYKVGTNNVVGSRKTGWAAPTGTATRTTFATSSVTTEQLAERVKALIDDLTSHGLIGT